MKIFKRLFNESSQNTNIVSIAEEHLIYLSKISNIRFFSKYLHLFMALVREGFVKQSQIHFVEDPIRNDFIYYAHKPNYIHNIEETLLFGDYIFEDIRMDNQLYEIIRIFCNATLQSSLIAVNKGFSMVIGGGFHHAKADEAGGYCVLNDIAIASNVMIKKNHLKSILIIDLDVHQGDGTASIFENNSHVFTFSMHQEDNFPYKKQKSSLDVSINSSDFTPKVYLYNLRNSLNCLLKDREFDLIYYIAGADTMEGDKLGSFSLSVNDLKKRDNIVFRYARETKSPLVVLMGGSYNIDINMEIEAYKNTIRSLWSNYL